MFAVKCINLFIELGIKFIVSVKYYIFILSTTSTVNRYIHNILLQVNAKYLVPFIILTLKARLK